MSSNILYKWRSGTTFESLNLLGSAAKLFEVKKAIVLAKRLNSGSMDFDLIVTDADTQEEYTDETKNLRTGRRLIVQRVPARPGHGFLARMARQEQGGDIAAPPAHLQNKSSHVPSGFYTIDGRAREADEEEFVDTAADNGSDHGDDEDKELAALQAVTAVQHQGPVMTGGLGTGRRGGPPGPAGMGGPPRHQSRPPNFHGRPNADPDLREHEVREPKRLTGIPRTFMNLNAQSQADGGHDGEEGAAAGTMGAILQPNKRGFDELVKRKGGQSANTAGTRRDLDYALKLTSTTIPDHLKCAITGGLVKNAMLLPWDPEGRTVSETAIRDALTQNMFRCPLTGTEGVSPDDLIPNIGLRKAAEAFVKSVMDKVDEIEQQQVEDSAPASVEEGTKQDAEKNVVDGDGVETGVITVSKRTSLSSHKKADHDLFGDDDFGGDVFAVPVKRGKAAGSAKESSGAQETSTAGGGDASDRNDVKDASERPKDDKSPNEANDFQSDAFKNDSNVSIPTSPDKTGEVGSDSQGGSLPASSNSDNYRPAAQMGDNAIAKSMQGGAPPAAAAAASSHRRIRRRGPPAGYTMGLGGGRISSHRTQAPSANSFGRGYHDESSFPPQGDRGGGRGFSPRGGRNHNGALGAGFGRGEGGRGSRFNGEYPDDESRGTKRSRDDHSIDGESTGGGSTGMNRMKCYNCGEDGHFARDCPKYNPRMEGAGGRGGRGGRFHQDLGRGSGPGDFRSLPPGRGWDGPPPGRGGGGRFQRGGRGGRGRGGRGGRF